MMLQEHRIFNYCVCSLRKKGLAQGLFVFPTTPLEISREPNEMMLRAGAEALTSLADDSSVCRRRRHSRRISRRTHSKRGWGCCHKRPRFCCGYMVNYIYVCTHSLGHTSRRIALWGAFANALASLVAVRCKNKAPGVADRTRPCLSYTPSRLMQYWRGRWPAKNVVLRDFVNHP